MEKNQSRYFYTASLMNEALLQLLEKKDIEYITVSELAKKAGVNRSTFYLHYEDIYDLLEETICNTNKAFINAFDKSLIEKTKAKRTLFFISDEFLIPYLNFCKEYKRLFKLAHKKPILFQRDMAYNKMYESILYPAISEFLKDETEKIYTLEFFTQGVAAIINKWINLDCKTDINQLILIIKKCVGYKE